MTKLRNAWPSKQGTGPTQRRHYTIPRPPIKNPLKTISTANMMERFKTFSTNMFDRAKNFFWQSKMNARILTHGITENDVIYKIKHNPGENIDTFLNYLKDIDQEKANTFLDKILLSTPQDNEIVFLSGVITEQAWNDKPNYDALEKLIDWMSLKLMKFLTLPNTEDIITDMIIYLIGLDHKQKIGKQIVLNLSNVCQTTTGRYLIKEISIFGTVLQKTQFKKYQQQVGKKIFVIWSNIVNALKENKKLLAVLEESKTGKDILAEIKKHEELQLKKTITEMTRTVIE